MGYRAKCIAAIFLSIAFGGWGNASAVPHSTGVKPAPSIQHLPYPTREQTQTDPNYAYQMCWRLSQGERWVELQQWTMRTYALDSTTAANKLAEATATC